MRVGGTASIAVLEVNVRAHASAVLHDKLIVFGGVRDKLSDKAALLNIVHVLNRAAVLLLPHPDGVLWVCSQKCEWSKVCVSSYAQVAVGCMIVA